MLKKKKKLRMNKKFTYGLAFTASKVNTSFIYLQKLLHFFKVRKRAMKQKNGKHKNDSSCENFILPPSN